VDSEGDFGNSVSSRVSGSVGWSAIASVTSYVIISGAACLLPRVGKEVLALVAGVYPTSPCGIDRDGLFVDCILLPLG